MQYEDEYVTHEYNETLHSFLFPVFLVCALFIVNAAYDGGAPAWLVLALGLGPVLLWSFVFAITGVAGWTEMHTGKVLSLIATHVVVGCILSPVIGLYAGGIVVGAFLGSAMISRTFPEGTVSVPGTGQYTSGGGGHSFEQSFETQGRTGNQLQGTNIQGTRAQGTFRKGLGND